MGRSNDQPALIVRVRGARGGRGAAATDEQYGELLMTYLSPVLIEVGDLVTLLDGSKVPVVDVEEQFRNGRLSQDVTIEQ